MEVFKLSAFHRKTRFKADCNKAYRLIRDNGVISDTKLQYLMDVSVGVWYRIRGTLLDNPDLFPDISLEGGVWRFLKVGQKEEEHTPKQLPIDHWGSLEPDEGGKGPYG